MRLKSFSLQGRLEEFFNQYGVISAVRMRRDENKKFKVCRFAEFRDYDSVNAFLKADPKPTQNFHITFTDDCVM